MLINKIFSFILIIFLFASCASTNKTLVKTKTPELNKLYKRAYDEFSKGNYNQSVFLFEQVEKDYSYTDWAAKALLMRAFMYYDSSNYLIALKNLQKFKIRYQGNKNIPYAEYLIALCLFEQINEVSLSQKNTDLALKQFNKIINLYPNSSYAIDSKFKIDLINEQLAGKEIYLARYYMQRNKWTPALKRLNNVVNNYQSTIFIEEALHRLVEIHYLIGNIAIAKKYAAVLGYNYNESDWYKRSYNIVESKNISTDKKEKKKSFKEKFKQLINIQ